MKKWNCTKMLSYSLFLAVMISNNKLNSQELNISLDPFIPEQFTGLQSYAWAKEGNKVLLIGGRTDGLHQKQPFASFKSEFNNTNLIVVDLENEKVWKRPIAELSSTLVDQLQSTNMQFWQQESHLVIAGGYGYSQKMKNHITHPFLTIIDIKSTINAIINEKPLNKNIRQIKDERMAITGGHLVKLGNSYLLVGGHRFDGRYNPHSPEHGPGYKQQYSNEIRKFTLQINNLLPKIENYTTLKDTNLFHRRDFNLVPQYNDHGEKIYTIYSGVFRTDADLPYHSLVDINENGGTLINNFSQLFCHYHTANLPIYNFTNKTQYTVFFGGIAQYFKDSAGIIKEDIDVPFTKTISVIKRKDGKNIEYTLPVQMPGYFGASASFIPADNSLFDNHANLKWESLSEEKILAGYIIGGIDSSEPNVFWDPGNYGSIASTVIWKVYVKNEK